MRRPRQENRAKPLGGLSERSIDYQDIQPNGKPMADGDMRKAFSTPRIMMDDGKPILISIGSHAFYCL